MTTIAQHWIDGEWVGSDTVSDSLNPATGEVLGQWYDGGETEAAAAIAAAAPDFRHLHVGPRPGASQSGSP